MNQLPTRHPHEQTYVSYPPARGSRNVPVDMLGQVVSRGNWPSSKKADREARRNLWGLAC